MCLCVLAGDDLEQSSRSISHEVWSGRVAWTLVLVDNVPIQFHCEVLRV